MMFGRELYIIGVFLILSFLSAIICKRKNAQALDLETSVCMKGLCAVMIVIGHCISESENQHLASFNVGWYCVAVFFFWSGYGIANGFMTKSGYLSHFWNVRLQKIFIPFTIANVVYYVVKFFCGFRFGIRSIVLSFLGQCTIVDNSWYPFAVIVFYVAFYFAAKRSPAKIAICSRLAVLMVLVTSVEAILLTSKEDWWVISNGGFLLGVSIRLFGWNVNDWKKYVSIGLIGYFLGLLIMPICNRLLGYSFVAYILSCNIMSTSIAFILSIIVGKLGLCLKILYLLGEWSYELYLYHGLFIFLTKTFISNKIGVLIICVLSGSILFSYMMHSVDRYILKKCKRIG